MAARLTGRLVATAALVAVFGTGCGVGASSSGGATFPPQSFGPSGAGTTAAVAATRGELVRVLGTKSLQLANPTVPFRPAESSRLAAAPRAVYQVLLPSDPGHGFISVYEFTDPAAAAGAGNEQAAYVGSGVGRVQFPPDTRFVIRQVGTTIVFYTWSPANAPDPRTADIQAALETLGTGFAVPS